MIVCCFTHDHHETANRFTYVMWSGVDGGSYVCIMHAWNQRYFGPTILGRQDFDSECLLVTHDRPTISARVRKWCTPSIPHMRHHVNGRVCVCVENSKYHTRRHYRFHTVVLKRCHSACVSGARARNLFSFLILWKIPMRDCRWTPVAISHLATVCKWLCMNRFTIFVRDDDMRICNEAEGQCMWQRVIYVVGGPHCISSYSIEITRSCQCVGRFD